MTTSSTSNQPFSTSIIFIPTYKDHIWRFSLHGKNSLVHLSLCVTTIGSSHYTRSQATTISNLLNIEKQMQELPGDSTRSGERHWLMKTVRDWVSKKEN